MNRLPHQPCTCESPGITVADGRVVAHSCKQCLLAATSEKINRAWGGDGAVLPIQAAPKLNGKPHSAAPKSTYPCTKRGAAIGVRATCAEGCTAGTSLPVLACSEFGTCVVAKSTKECHAVCRDCESRVPPEVAATTAFPDAPKGPA